MHVIVNPIHNLNSTQCTIALQEQQVKHVCVLDLISCTKIPYTAIFSHFYSAHVTPVYISTCSTYVEPHFQ